MGSKFLVLELLVCCCFLKYSHSQQFPATPNGNVLIGIGVYRPYVEKYTDISKSMITTNYRGLLIDLINLIKNEIGPEFNYQFVEYETLSTRRNASGFLGPIMEDLMVGKIQIAAGPFLADDLNASQFFQFTAPYTSNHGLSILMKSELTQKNQYYQRYTLFMDYVLNLDSNVWGVITACYVVACFLWFLIDRITGCCGPYDSYNVWALIAKLSFANWLLFFVIVTALIIDDENYYARFRTDQTKDIRSLDDLNKISSSVRFLMVNNSRATQYFQNLAELEGRFLDSQLETVFRKPPTTVTTEERSYFESLIQQRQNFRNIWSKINNNGFVRDFPEAVNMMINDYSGNTVFIGDYPEVRYATIIDCNLKYFETPIASKSMAIALPLNSRWKNPIDEALLKLSNQRKIQQNEDKWWDHNPNDAKCNSNYGGKSQLYRLAWLFVALCISAALAIAAGLTVGGLFATIESCCKLCFRHKDAEFTTVHHTQPVVMVQRNGME